MFNGSVIEQLRKQNFMSQLDLIAKLYNLGLRISRPTLRNWEKNITTPDAHQLSFIARVFKKQIDYFYTKGKEAKK